MLFVGSFRGPELGSRVQNHLDFLDMREDTMTYSSGPQVPKAIKIVVAGLLETLLGGSGELCKYANHPPHGPHETLSYQPAHRT